MSTQSLSLYQYIMDNLDPEDENFTQATLPDEPHPTVPHPLGSEDAFWFATSAPSLEQEADTLVQLLDAYRLYPDQPHRQRLYAELKEQPLIAVAGALCDKLHGKKIDAALVALGRSFFYNAQHRGPLKFAYILLGLYGMERIKKESPELWEDLVKVARCEEFTYFFLFACSLTEYKPFKEIWRLIGCTEGWGKIFSIETCECRDESQELWLIQHGMETSIEYPPLAAHLMEIAHVPHYLAQAELDERTYNGIAVILNTFLVLLDNYDEEALETNINTAVVRPVQLVQDFLRHARVHAKQPEAILQVLNISFGLRNLEDNDKLCLMGQNDIELLIGECDSIIYAQDWTQYVKDNLIVNDTVNYELADFACEMDMDIFKPLCDYLCGHPCEYKILPYLFSYNDPGYQQFMVQFVEHNLAVYAMDESALLVPLRYLAQKPGEGERIIIAGLTGLYDWPRGVACSVLSAWGPEHMNEPLRTALREALELSNNPVVTARIEALLKGQRFSVEDMFQ